MRGIRSPPLAVQPSSLRIRRKAVRNFDLLNGIPPSMTKKLEAIAIKIARKVGEQDKLFGSVTALDIAEALAAQGQKIDRRLIHLPEPIRALGQFEVELRLHREVSTKIKVEVVGQAQ